MKRVLATMLVALLMMSAGCKKSNNNAVITVNDTPITQQEVDDIVNKQMSSPFFAQLDKDSEEAKLMVLIAKDKAINELIVKKLIDNEILKRGITVSEEDMANYKANLLKEIGGEENFKMILKSNNINETQFKEMIANEIQVAKLINALSPIVVTDGEVKKFYNDNKAAKFTHPDMVRASHILIKDEAKAKEVLAKAQAPGANFAELAKKYSEDTGSAVKGGDLDYFSREQMVKPFADAAFSLKPDNISGLVKSEFGYHIIKVVDRRKAGTTPYEETKDTIKKYLEDEKKVQVLQKFIDSQKAIVKVEYIDPTYKPENIKKEVQKYTEQAKIAPEPTNLPKTQEVQQ